MKQILFICSQNKLRSPTAEEIFNKSDKYRVLSAGTSRDAQFPICKDLIEESDRIFVMEKYHYNRLTKMFKSQLKNKRVNILNIPDVYKFMQPELVALLKAKVLRYLPDILD